MKEIPLTQGKITGRNQRIQQSSRKNSKFKGVSIYRQCPIRPWGARIKINKIGYIIGNFRTEEAAALAYNEAAKLHFKEFAKLNVL